MRFFAVFLLVAVGFAPLAGADVHVVVVSEFYTQCADGNTDVQYIELTSEAPGQYFRQCATLQFKRTVGGPDVFLADPVYAGRSDSKPFAEGMSWLIATPAFQAATGIVPNVLMPNGTLNPEGGVIRYAADTGCPLVNWGTIHEVHYGDQGEVAAPGLGEAQHFVDAGHTWELGDPSPKNFSGDTSGTWSCPSVPVTERTWGWLKAVYSRP